MAEESSSNPNNEASESMPDTEVRRRLSSMQDALEQIEAKVHQDAESIDQVRDALDTSYLEQVAELMQELEERVETVEDQAREAEESLREEQQRLEKLWRVYKSQEQELEEAEKQRRAAERRVDELESELESTEETLRSVRAEKGELEEQLADKQARIEQLRDGDADGERVDELQRQLEEERARLAKLYGVFEETEDERDRFRSQAKRWTSWYEDHEDALAGATRALTEMPNPNVTPDEPEPASPDDEA
jgi:chromosome segregation ATPase